MLIDTHTHLNSEPFAGHLEQVLSRSRQAGVTAWITVGTNLTGSAAALELADKYENMFAAVGVHPHEASRMPKSYISELEDMAKHERVVAVGELGLDYHYDFSDRPSQRRVMEEQLAMAERLGLPVVVHCREAFDDCLAILDAWKQDRMDIVFHCFSGSKQQAGAILDRGGNISLTGTITFKNAADIQKVAAYVPLERIMLETDCPYLSPEPKRNIKPNEPALLVHTAEKLALLKNCHSQEIAETTTAAAIEFFGLKI